MRSRLRSHWRLLLLILVGAVVACVEHRLRTAREGEALARAASRLPNGITAQEVEQRLGVPPDEVSQQRGVLLNDATFLSASNSQAASAGKTQPYEIRVWRRGSVTAAVVLDQRGQVVGRNVTRPHRERSFWRRLEQWLSLVLPPIS
jgi:hypothetical protein